MNASVYLVYINGGYEEKSCAAFHNNDTNKCNLHASHAEQTMRDIDIAHIGNMKRIHLSICKSRIIVV